MADNNRTAFPDMFLEDMKPELEQIIVDKFNSKPDIVKEIFNVESMTGSIENSDTVGTFPAATQITEGASVDYFQFKQGYDKVYVPTKWGLGMKVTEEMVDDDKWGLIGKQARALGKSVYETIQIRAFNVFNNGFSTAGADGDTLFSTSHPLLGGGTWSNSAAVDFTRTALENAVIAFSNMVDDENKKINVEPKILLIHPTNQFAAREVLNSTGKSGTADNNINSLKEEGIRIVTCSYLTDTGAWFLLADKDEHDLRFKNRKSPVTSSSYDFDTDTGKTKMKTRFDVGYNDARGTYGST